MNDHLEEQNAEKCVTSMKEDFLSLSPARKGIALSIAIVSDVLLESIPSPAGQVVDIGTGLLLFFCFGARWELLPTFIVEMIPGLGIFPTWTAVSTNFCVKNNKKTG